MKDKHVKDAAQGVAEDVPQDVARDLGFGAREARALLATPPPPPPPKLSCLSVSHGACVAPVVYLLDALML